jgi:CheY-like chemotaxis protein
MMVNDVLDITQIETGTFTVSIEPVALRLVIDDVLALLGPLATERGITIDNQASGDDAAVRADANRLRQVLVNLVANAIKFNRDGGSVTLSTAVDDAHVSITVSDTGRGIAAENLSRLFRPFERLDIQTGEVEGAGIGLALSRALVEQMDGSITVASELGHGSQFTVRLPRAGLASDQVPASAIRDEATDHVAKVLCIENNPGNALLIESAFALRPGIQLLFADRGSLGIELVRAHKPDLVLLDLRLPDMLGEDALARLHADPATARTPIIVICADAMPRRVAALIEAGAFAFLTDPVSVRDLLNTVDEALASIAHDV